MMTIYFILAILFFIIGIVAHIINKSFNKYDFPYVIGSTIVFGLFWPLFLVWGIYNLIKFKIEERKISKYIDDYNDKLKQ